MARLAILVLYCFALTLPASATPSSVVAFSLSLDYGVASVYHANGTHMGIAKVEGSSAYKQMMRTQKWSDDSSADNNDSGPDGYALQTLLFSPAALRDYLPPWLGGQHADPRVGILVPLLQALKAAAESYTGSGIPCLVIVLPARPPRSLSDVIDSAAAQLALDMLFRSRSPAGLLAAYANGIGTHNCSSHFCPEQLVLAVDFSRAATTAMLYVEDSGIFDELHGFHHTALGTDSWSAENRETLVSELRRIIQLPVEGVRGTVLNRIDALVLLGESGTDERLRSVLKDVLQGGGETNEQMNSMLDGDTDNMVDPLFAATIGAARARLAGMGFDVRQESDDTSLADGRKELR